MKEIVIGLIQLGTILILLSMLCICWNKQINIKNLKGNFTLIVFCLIYWLFCNTMRIFSESDKTILFWHEAKYLSVLPLPSLLLSFILTYIKKEVWLKNKLLIVIMSAIPFLTLISIVTDPVLHLFRIDMEVVFINRMATVITHNGPFFWINVVYTYSVMVLSILFLLIHYHKLPKYYRTQPLIFILGLLPPFFLNISYVFTIFEEIYDQTALAFVVTGLSYFWALYYFSTPEIIPIARELIIENMHHLLVVTDINNKIVDSNKSAKSVLKRFNIDALNISFDDSFKCDLAQAGVTLQERKEDKEIDIILDGEVKHYAYKKSPILHRHETIGHLHMFNDITNMKSMMLKLEEMATIDPLTQLHNRIYFNQSLDDLAKDAILPLSIIKGGINGLKMINDSLGNEVGDELIISTAHIFKEELQNKGFIARVSGDEFVAVLQNTSESDSKEYISQILNRCKDVQISHAKLSLCVSYSTMTNKEDSIRQHVKEANSNMYRKKLTESQSTRSSIIESLKTALEQSDFETKAHAERTQALAIKVGQKIGLSDSKLNDLSMLSVLHDIGKISIPDHILLKPSRLTDEEFEIIKTHSEKGYAIAIASPELVSIAKGILHHHERWDGGGYPSGLAQEDIPIEARLITIVDAYDVMTNDRPYHKAISQRDAINELIRCRGTQFDPTLVDVLLGILEDANK